MSFKSGKEPFCPDCGKFMVPKHNGVIVFREKDCLWLADVWYCKGCGKEIITGFGENPLIHHWKEPEAFENFLQSDRMRFEVIRNE